MSLVHLAAGDDEKARQARQVIRRALRSDNYDIRRSVELALEQATPSVLDDLADGLATRPA